MIPNWIVILAAEIAMRVPEMARDSVVNNSELLEKTIAAAMAEAAGEVVDERAFVVRMEHVKHAAEVLARNGLRMGCVVREDFKLLTHALAEVGVELPEPAPEPHRVGIYDEDQTNNNSATKN